MNFLVGGASIVPGGHLTLVLFCAKRLGTKEQELPIPLVIGNQQKDAQSAKIKRITGDSDLRELCVLGDESLFVVCRVIFKVGWRLIQARRPSQ